MGKASKNPLTDSDPGFLVGCGEMGERIRAFNWSKTPIGPVKTWSPALRTVIRVILANRLPMLLWWGPEYVCLYNDPYRPMLGNKHPWALGRPVSEVWREIWHVLKPLIDTPFHGGPATWDEDILLVVNRYGFNEETHWLIAYSPVPDESAASGIGGVLATVHETTAKVLSERRMTALRDLGRHPVEAKSAAAACSAAARTLEGHGKDIPFAMIYLTEGDGAKARLVASAGVAAGQDISPQLVDLEGSSTAWPWAETKRTMQPQVVANIVARFPSIPPGPWTDPPNTALILPIGSGKEHEPAGFFIAGLSSHLRLDDAYRDFLSLVSTQIGTAIANARAYEEEKRRAESLAELDRAKTTFFSNVSHEFRTPLTLILAPLDDAIAHAGAGRQRDALLTLQRNARRLQKLVNTLLDFSRIEAGRVQASYQAVDLAALTRDLASNFRSACEKAGLELNVDCSALPEPVYVDVEMWEKIVLNLISNAFKFTLNGRIEVRLRQSNGQAELVVSDTGVGIAADQMPRLFERFHRVEGVNGRSQEGSGIGLALVRELVRLHGGEISAASELDKGTSFVVTIPLGAAHVKGKLASSTLLNSTALRAGHFVEEALRWLPNAAPADEKMHNLLGESELEWTRSDRKNSERPRIVLADDNADTRQYLQRILSERYEVEPVRDGEEALEAVQRSLPDLILADVAMPHLDGFGLLKALRADPRTSGLPVVMLTARAGEESRVEGMMAGADDYLVKPFSARELLARVGAHVQMARLREQASEAVRKNEERMRLLWESAAVLLTTDDADTMLRDLFAKIAPHLNLDTYFNFMVNDTGNGLKLASYIGISDDTARGIENLEFGQAISGTVALLRKPIAATFIQQSDDPKAKLVKSLGIRACACNPLSTEDGLLGTLSFASRSRDEFDADELDFLQTICRYVTAAYERLRLIGKLRDSDRRKDEFLATLGHELRNPLAPIRNGLQILRLAGVSGELADDARNMMERQVAQMVRLIDDLLDLSRISRGKIELKKERIALADVVQHAVETSRPLIEQEGHELTVEIPSTPIFVEADLTRLAQVFSNLLNNAAKYTEPGGRIRLSVRKRGGELQVSVRDNGIGIPAQMLPRVFDMFTQINRSLERSQGGLGIGLSIVKSLVEMHGGSIEAKSGGHGLGSEFIVRLPAAPSVVQPRKRR
jgi:signal transduction histidine kinase/FixJ family two-component response regulator